MNGISGDGTKNLLFQNLTGSKLPGAKYLGANFLGVKFSGSDLRYADLRTTSLTTSDLSGTNLIGANLNGATVSAATLSNSNLSGANLSNANLRGADFINANLSGADLSGADLSGADLTGADLTGADFTNVIFNDADLSNVKLDRSKMGKSIFGDVDLSVPKGLENVKHYAPSTIGIDTLYRSKGKIPEIFLRGCGVPEAFFHYIPSFIGAEQTVQFYSCFISYSTQDEEFAKRLHSRMQAEKLRVWFAPEDIKGGEKIVDQIDTAIRIYDKLLLVLSESSMKSKWVVNEVRRARKAEDKEGRRKLFPIRLVEYGKVEEWEQMTSTGEDVAEEIRQYYIPDFSNWKDYDAFEAEFERLLRDLRAEEKINKLLI